MLQKDDLSGKQESAKLVPWSVLWRWWRTSLPGATIQNDVREKVYDQATLSVSFIVMNILATIVASYGLLANSTAVVIGAMVIAILLGPIMGMALGLLESYPRLLWRAILTEIVGVAVVMGVSMLIGSLYRDIPAGNELLSRTSPNTFDLVIALAGGAAGAYATVSPRLAVGLVGVAVATALVPPLCTCGILLVRGDVSQAGGALLLFLTNIVAIQCSSSAVFLLTGYARVLQPCIRWRAMVLRHGPSVILLLILIVVLGASLKQDLDRTLYETKIREQLTRALQANPIDYLTDVRFDYEGKITVVTAVLRTPTAFTPAQVVALEAHLSPPASGTLELHVRAVLTVETTPKGTVVPSSLVSP
jgi:uncharacterized hydrophobic protein (TIGR00271 family)